MRQEGEPSVEEILDSIKKVIARDNRDSAMADRQRRARAEQPPVEEPQPEVAEVLDLDEADAVVRDEDEADVPGLTNETAARSMRDSLAALAMIAEPGVPPQIVRSGETSLEGLAREMLRPMLAKWLDDHLPDMVERLVTAEITRIAHKKG